MERWLKRKAPDDANNLGNSHQQNNNVNVNPIPPAPEDIDREEEIQFDPGKRKDTTSANLKSCIDSLFARLS